MSGQRVIWDLIRITFRQYLKNSEIAWRTCGGGRLKKLMTFELPKNRDKSEIA